MRRQFFRPAPRSIWTVVSFAPQIFPLSEVEQSVNKLKQSCERLGEHPYRFRSLTLTLLLGMRKPLTCPRLFSKLTISRNRRCWRPSCIRCWWGGEGTCLLPEVYAQRYAISSRPWRRPCRNWMPGSVRNNGRRVWYWSFCLIAQLLSGKLSKPGATFLGRWRRNVS